MTEENGAKEQLPIKTDTHIGMVSGGLVPHSFDGLWQMASIMAKSGLMPKGIESREAVVVVVQMGMEVGLSPMQAVQNIAVIGGRPSIWGDSVLALVRASGLLELFVEEFSGSFPGDDYAALCTAQRKGDDALISRSFSIMDAKQAGLWTQGTSDPRMKLAPWFKYPKRMLQMRARSWALRDGFGDVLKGLRMAEEVMDYDLDMQPTQAGRYEVKTEPPENLTDKLKSTAKKPDYVVPDTKEDMPAAAEMVKQEAQISKAEHEAASIARPAPKPWTCPHCGATVQEGKECRSDKCIKRRGGVPESHKQEQSRRNAEFDGDLEFYNEWYKIREAGFSTYVFKNMERFAKASPELMVKAKAKWARFYTQPWPLEKPKQEEPGDQAEQGQGETEDPAPDTMEQARRENGARVDGEVARSLKEIMVNSAEYSSLIDWKHAEPEIWRATTQQLGYEQPKDMDECNRMLARCKMLKDGGAFDM